jgi:cytochrome c-type biogenesis protein CcmH
MNMKKYLWGVILALFVSGVFTGGTFAQETTPTDDEVNAIAKQLYCPVCENTPLDVCPTEACRQWRDLIRQQLADGWTEEQIKDYFVDNYGARVLAEPPREGLNWLVYLIPPAIILTGAIILFRTLQGWTRPKVVPSGQVTASSKKDEYIVRIEEELKKRQ